MSKQTRPLSHQIGDIACAQISSLFSSQGWVVNPVLRDYGEDLVVQICQEGRLTLRLSQQPTPLLLAA